MISFGEFQIPQLTFFLIMLIYVLSMIELFFYVGIFSKVKSYSNEAEGLPYIHPPVSVIVCLRNEVDHLKELIPAIMSQNHPEFELILVADRSEKSTLQFLEQQKQRFPTLRLIHLGGCPEGISPKKNALNHGIQQAQHDVLLFTDADCIPASKNWISRMAACYKPGIEIVLGYGAYKAQDSWLNLLIRIDTLITAAQYLGRALTGNPYMGVGRNLSYRKEVFEKAGGFGPHLHILGGDDDLMVGRMVSPGNTSVCLDTAAFTWSAPKEILKDWLQQKIRHLSVSPSYKQEDKKALTLFHISRSLGWILLTILFFQPLGLLPAVFLLLLRTAYRFFPLRQLNRSLDAGISTSVLLVLDIAHSFIIFFVAILGILRSPKKWEN